MVTPMSTDEKTDQAALMGAATVGILTVVFAEGPWDLTTTIFGLILLAVLFAYYRPPAPVWRPLKSVAFAGTGSLVTFIALAYPFQELITKRLYSDLARPNARVEMFAHISRQGQRMERLISGSRIAVGGS